jgi:tetratricopeptide (TPR) repeat protein
MSLRKKIIILFSALGISIFLGYIIGIIVTDDGLIHIYSKEIRKIDPNNNALIWLVGVNDRYRREDFAIDILPEAKKQAEQAMVYIIIFQIVERTQFMLFHYDKIVGENYAWVQENGCWSVLSDNKAFPNVMRGCTYYSQGNLQPAIDQFSQALTITPNLAKVLIYRGMSYAKLNENEKAAKDLNAAIELSNDDNPNASNDIYFTHFVLGNLYFSTRDDKKSLENFKSYIDGIPDETKENQAILTLAYNDIADYMASSDDSSLWNGKEALKYINKAESIDKSGMMASMIADTHASAEARVGNYKDAVMYEVKAMKLNKDTNREEDMKKRLNLYKNRKPYTQNKYDKLFMMNNNTPPSSFL